MFYKFKDLYLHLKFWDDMSIFYLLMFRTCRGLYGSHNKVRVRKMRLGNIHKDIYLSKKIANGVKNRVPAASRYVVATIRLIP